MNDKKFCFDIFIDGNWDLKLGYVESMSMYSYDGLPVSVNSNCTRGLHCNVMYYKNNHVVYELWNFT